ncbi:MAG: cobaltochelatase subunit CobN, partial [bacterium]
YALEEEQPTVDAVISLMGFSASDPNQLWEGFQQLNVPWYQWVISSNTRSEWRHSDRDGLGPKDITMKITLPEFDGRIAGPVVGFKGEPEYEQTIDGTVVTVEPDVDRIDAGINQIKHDIQTTSLNTPNRSVAIVLGNHPTSRARVGNAVGLDTPASLLKLLNHLKEEGYKTGSLPSSPQQLMEELVQRGQFDSNPPISSGDCADYLGWKQYRDYLRELPQTCREQLLDQWGDPSRSPRANSSGFPIPGIRFGNVIVLIQPPRGYDEDPNAVYHDPELPPPHSYVAFYRWITREFNADTMIHLGKHGTLEWLPGRSTGLSRRDWPELLRDDVPLVYPFIVNDPGEGSQAKRRTSAVIVDHLPAPQRKTSVPDRFEQLISLMENEPESDEYYEELHRCGLVDQLGLEKYDRLEWPNKVETFLDDLDGYDTRSGLHTLGTIPDQKRKVDYLESLAPDDSNRKTLKEILDRPEEFDGIVANELIPVLDSVPRELNSVSRMLDGGFVDPGPSGAPTRGRLECLPTGRNFYSRDVRGMPTRDAWVTGRELARKLVERYREDEGQYPERIGLVLWGTSNMRTGGEDVAQALALVGVRPCWTSGDRVDGVEPIPASERHYPRVDPLIRISGFFRDAFPHLVTLINEGIQTAADISDDHIQNHLRQHVQQEPDQSPRRVFGSKPGCYGAGLYPLIEQGNWQDVSDLSEAFRTWGKWSYDEDVEATQSRASLDRQLSSVEMISQNRDNHEHDLFDSDDYFQYHGGFSAAVQDQSDSEPELYVTDTHDPENVSVRSFRQEAARTFHGRVANDTWQEAMRDHGYKGAFEMTATVDYVFGYDATTGAIPDSMY